MWHSVGLMRILVLGQNGQIARSLVERSKACGLETLAVGRPELDITNRASIDKAIRLCNPDIVINAAAYTAVDQAEREPEIAFSINRDGAKYAAQAARAAGLPIIHISTDYVFDGKSQRPYRETDVTAPLNIYGCSKLEGEHAVAEAAPEHVILRTSWVFSPFGHNFADAMLRLAQDGTVRVVDDQTGCPTYAPDLAQAILDLCASWSKFNLNGLFHLAGNGETSRFGFASQIFQSLATRGAPKVVVRPITTADYPAAAKRPANSALNCTRFQAATGIRLPHWREATDRYAARSMAVNSGASR